MKKRDAMLTVLMVAACCYLSHVTAIQTTAVFTLPPYTPSSCFDEADKGTMIVGLDKSMWGNEAYCGKKLRVICMGPVTPEVTRACNPLSSTHVDVVIVDLCEDCEEGAMYLSKEAFDVIAYEDAGRIKVGYQWL